MDTKENQNKVKDFIGYKKGKIKYILPFYCIKVFKSISKAIQIFTTIRILGLVFPFSIKLIYFDGSFEQLKKKNRNLSAILQKNKETVVKI